VHTVDHLSDVISELDGTVEAVLVMPRCRPTRPNWAASVDEAHHRKLFLRLQRHRDGSSDVTGHLTPEATAVWITPRRRLGTPTRHRQQWRTGT
jgi:hypothetical protein